MMKPVGTPDVARIGRPDGPTQSDAVDDSLSSGTPSELASDLAELIGDDQVLTRTIDLVRYASDASPYRYVPQVVVQPRSIDDVKAVMKYAREHGRHLTFRAGGTSLNGQGQSDDILMDVRHHWYGMTAEEDGKQLRVKPGTVLDHCNQFLARYQRRLGPDPASAHAANVGGVIANNAGGMRCRIERNSYHTVRSMTFVLPSGTVINTEDSDAEDAFAAAEPELAQGLLDIRDRLRGDDELAERVRHKFRIRNTNGYTLNAFLDADTPLEIFRRLVIGSEGTLAFVAEVVFDTLTDPAKTTVAWIPVSSIEDAAKLVSEIEHQGAEAVELMLGSAMKAARTVWPKTPSYWDDMPDGSAALLIEFRRDTDKELDADEKAVHDIIDKHKTKLLHSLDFTRDAKTIDLYWTVREGLAGLVGAARPDGTAYIIEDVCFPPDQIAQGSTDLLEILGKHGFSKSVAGHAAYGNLHFTLITPLADEKGKDHYEAFMQDLVKLVVGKYDGSLKAEHGTGINMAPFVRYEWGDKATDMMWEIKRLADPHRVLGKDVMLCDDDKINLKNFKSTPTIEKVADKCIECGFCEPVCPSRNATVTPRQRIVLRREMARQPEDSGVLNSLLDDYEYDAIEMCAVDGTCELVCPVGINTGEFIKGFRRDESTSRREQVALSIAKHWETVEHLSRGAVGAADIVQQTVGTGLLTGVTEAMRHLIATDLLPTVPGPMPRPAPPHLPETDRKGAAAAYFPACINRIFGRDPADDRTPGLPEALVTVSARAGMPLWIPDDVGGKCCATPWSSKGYAEGHRWMSANILDAMWEWSDHGKLPIVIDAASCTWGIVDEVHDDLDDERVKKLDKITILDSIQWAGKLIPHLKIKDKIGRAAVHPTCSTTHLELDDALNEVVAAVADEVYTPIGTTCCGTAGDRGLLHPELVHSATREERAGLDDKPCDAYLSANRTCEMGMLQATDKPYESFVFLLEELSR